MWHPLSSPTRPTPRRRNASARRPRLESLEGRVVLSVAFDSVLGVGSDTAAVLAKDNAVDAAGNTYVTGYLYGPTDLDPAVDRPDGSDILTPRGSTDAFVAKYAPDNTLVWARLMGSTLNTSSLYTYEGGDAVSVDGSGNVYVSGGFLGQADFGPIRLTSAGDKDVFVAKLDSSGNFLWAKGWGGTTRDLSGGLAVDGSGNVVSVGTTATVASGGGSFTPNGFEVRKYGPTGTAAWTKRINGTNAEGTGVATDATGNVYLCGSFRGTMDFDPGSGKKEVTYVTGAAGAGNGFALKLTTSGSFAWVAPFVAKTAESPNSSAFCTDIAVDVAGDVVVGGYYGGQVDFNPSPTVDYRLPSSGGGFAAKLSSAGALAWATPLGGAYINSLALDASGSVYLTGNFSQVFTPGFGLPSATSNGGSDVFVAQLSNTGAVNWAVTFGGTGSDNGYAVAVDSAGTVYVAGTYSNTVDFDPDPVATYELTNPAKGDMFLLKLRRR
ncbi:hypothetical protein EP7_002500 [Isosphaeraceae bacterium EP7]